MNRTYRTQPAVALLLTLLTFGTLAVVSPVAAQVAAVPQLLSFQGRLAKPNGTPVPDGTYSLRFSLWNVASGGTPVNEKWNQTLASVTVRSGTFVVLLGSGAAFPAGLFNTNLWLEIKIGSDNPLTPRQQVVSVAYAFKADMALTVPDGSLTNAKIASGTLTADKFAANVFNPLAWVLGGNSATNPANQFLGTTDNQSLVFKVNGRQAMRYSYAENTALQSRSINVLGGSEINSITAGAVGATIAGGGSDSFTGTDAPNLATGDFGTIGGGGANTVGRYATVAGGISNVASSDFAAIGGGVSNTVTGTYASVGGGSDNIASGTEATVAGGFGNTANGTGATVAGGVLNIANAASATVAGGSNNTAAGNYSFAAGFGANASHDGAFVWADGQGSNFFSTAVNQFCIRASGGIVLETGQNAWMYTSFTAGEKNRYFLLLNSPQTQSASGIKVGGILCADSYSYSNPGKNDMTVKGKAAIGYDVNTTGGYKFAVSGTTFSFGGYFGSDARYKKNIAPLENALDSVLRLRGVSYEWDKAKFPQQNFGEGKQMGFIAQDVETIFPELVITAPDGYKAVNYTGVIPVLVEAVKTQNGTIQVLKNENTELKARLARLETLVEKLVKTRNK